MYVYVYVYMYVYVYVCACVRVCVCACVRVCVQPAFAQVGLRPLSSACSDKREALQDKLEQLQASELEAEGLLILLQGLGFEG